MSTETTRASKRSCWFAVSLIAASAWLVALLVLAIRTANPETLNRSQLLTADAVVIARPDEPRTSERAIPLVVERVLAGGELPSHITVRVTDDNARYFGDSTPYLIPLRRAGANFVVAPVPTLHRDPSARGIVMVPVETAEAKGVFYAATDDTRQAAERILATGAQKPYP